MRYDGKSKAMNEAIFGVDIVVIVWKGWRMKSKLLSVSADNKTVKGETEGFLTAILYLAPADEAGKNVCPHASKGCRQACLWTAGKGALPKVREARIRKTKEFLASPTKFVERLYFDIKRFLIDAEEKGMFPAIRLNGTSDINWGAIKYKGKSLFEHFPQVSFYDYTKNPNKVKTNKFPNYHLTFSRSESPANHKAAKELLAMGFNVAVVFKNKPDTYWGAKVIDGDKNDLRFLDPKGVVVGLKAKGKARKDESGFVV